MPLPQRRRITGQKNVIDCRQVHASNPKRLPASLPERGKPLRARLRPAGDRLPVPEPPLEDFGAGKGDSVNYR